MACISQHQLIRKIGCQLNRQGVPVMGIIMIIIKKRKETLTTKYQLFKDSIHQESPFILGTSLKDSRPLMNDWLFRESIFYDLDISDISWFIIVTVFRMLIPFAIVHTVITQILWRKYPNILVIQLFYIVFSVTCLSTFLQWKGLLFVLSQPVVSFVSRMIGYRKLCWFCGIIYLHLSHMDDFMSEITNPDSLERSIINFLTPWMMIRCTSFSMSSYTKPLTSPTEIYKEWLCFLAYCFYFPLLFTGPPVFFEDFHQQLLKPRNNLNGQVADVVRILGWFLLGHLCRHVLYPKALTFHADVLQNLDAFDAWAIAVWLEWLFFMKFVVLFGLPSYLAGCEKFHTPAIPKCIAVIGSSAELWRCFDRGLYEFVKRFIYLPGAPKNSTLSKQLHTAMQCFLFSCVWHGISGRIFSWAAINFICYALETVTIQSCSTFSAEWSRRAWLYVMIFIVTPTMRLGTLIFLTDPTRGLYLFSKFLDGSWTFMFATVVNAYCWLEFSSWYASVTKPVTVDASDAKDD